MTSREWLERGFKLNMEIEQLNLAKENAKELCDSAQGEAWKSYREYSKILFRKIDRLLEINKEIVQAISGVDDVLLRTILTARYINCKTWRQIAEDMEIDERWVYRLHKKALEKINI